MQDGRSVRPTSEQEHPAVALTREFIRRASRNDDTWCLSVCSPTITLIGESREVYAQGIDEVVHAVLNQPKQTEELLLGTIETACDQIPDANIVIVTARFLVASDPTKGTISASQNRATFVWGMTGDGYRLLHLHRSKPHEYHGEDDPRASINHETYRYAKALIDQIVRRSAVSIRDVSGAIHYVSDVEVRYIEANRQRSILHCLNESIVVRRGFKDLVEEFGNVLVPIHRSFAVNPMHVKSLRTDVVVLDDGSEVPLPQRKSAEMRQRLSNAIERLEATRGGNCSLARAQAQAV